MNLTYRFALFTSLLCLVIIGGITILSYGISARELESSVGQRLEAIVRSAAIHIDGTQLEQVLESMDAQSEAFISIRDDLRALKEANSLSTDIYTLTRVGETLKFGVMTNEKPFIGDEYSIRPEMLPTLNDSKPSRTGIYTDVHGEWISAYAPILDRDGRISGLLEADIRVDEYMAVLRGKFFWLVWKGVGFGLFAVIVSFLLAKTVTRKLVYLKTI